MNPNDGSMPVVQKMRAEKVAAINAALYSDPVDLDALRELALTDGGLLSSDLRVRAWPKLLEARSRIPSCSPSRRHTLPRAG